MPRHSLAALSLLAAAALAANRSYAQPLLPAPPGASATDDAAVDRSERVARATVVVLVGGAIRARGVALANDGRVVTALAPLAGEATLSVRYPSGRTDAVSVVATDPLWGLALLQPRAGSWPEGLPLATAARRNVPVRWTVGDEPRSLGGVLHARHTYVGHGAELLRDAWELDPMPPEGAVGSGVANAAGELVAVIVAPDPSVIAGAAPAPFGVPVTVVRDLVARAGNTARPWLGLVARELRPQDGAAVFAAGGLRVTQVTQGGPAARAGVRGAASGDVLVAVDGAPVRATADLGAALEGHHPGDTLSLQLVRQGARLAVPLVLGEFPPLPPR